MHQARKSKGRVVLVLPNEGSANKNTYDMVAQWFRRNGFSVVKPEDNREIIPTTFDEKGTPLTPEKIDQIKAERPYLNYPLGQEGSVLVVKLMKEDGGQTQIYKPEIGTDAAALDIPVIVLGDVRQRDRGGFAIAGTTHGKTVYAAPTDGPKVTEMLPHIMSGLMPEITVDKWVIPLSPAVHHAKVHAVAPPKFGSTKK